MVCKFKFVTTKEKLKTLGADSQGQNLYSGSRLPSSKSWSLEPTPRVKILTLGAGSQAQNLYSGSRLPETRESVVYTWVGRKENGTRTGCGESLRLNNKVLFFAVLSCLKSFGTLSIFCEKSVHETQAIWGRGGVSLNFTRIWGDPESVHILA